MTAHLALAPVIDFPVERRVTPCPHWCEDDHGGSDAQHLRAVRSIRAGGEVFCFLEAGTAGVHVLFGSSSATELCDLSVSAAVAGGRALLEAARIACDRRRRSVPKSRRRT